MVADMLQRIGHGRKLLTSSSGICFKQLKELTSQMFLNWKLRRMSKPPLYIIVLSNGQHEDTDACLTSLLESDYKDVGIILLNQSLEAASSVMFQRKYPQIQIINLSENLGYAGNNNIGIKSALDQGAEWIFILNNDTVLDRSCISSLVNVGKSNPAAGILGPMVYHFSEPGVIQSAGGVLGKYW
jgi:GT2 family glycosyltransferase